MKIGIIIYHLEKNLRVRIALFLSMAILAQWLHGFMLMKIQHYAIDIPDATFVEFFYLLVLLASIAYWHALSPTKQVVGPLRFTVRKLLIAGALICLTVPQVRFTHTTLVILDFAIQALACGFIAWALFPNTFFKKYHLELSFIAIASGFMKLLAFFVALEWEKFAYIILHGVDTMLTFFRQTHHTQFTTQLVELNKFSVIVGPACAGVGILTGFFILFLFSILLLHTHHQHFSGTRIACALIGGCILAYLLNTLRIISILLMGEYISPTFAASTFHNTIGAFLFLSFFIVYIFYSTRWATHQKK
jgi:exosortase/archaeosortase family protein